MLLIPPKPVAAADGTVPAAGPITAKQFKEIKIGHKAPIVGITVFDRNTGLPLEWSAGAAPTNTAQSVHRVAIATEQQILVYSVPVCKCEFKYKMMAEQGDRIRRMSFAKFLPTSTAAGPVRSYEMGVMCLTNYGECNIFPLDKVKKELKKALNAAAVRQEDIK